jgi:hypothetical protein
VIAELRLVHLENRSDEDLTKLDQEFEKLHEKLDNKLNKIEEKA